MNGCLPSVGAVCGSRSRAAIVVVEAHVVRVAFDSGDILTLSPRSALGVIDRSRDSLERFVTTGVDEDQDQLSQELTLSGKVDRAKNYVIADALALVKETAKANHKINFLLSAIALEKRIEIFRQIKSYCHPSISSPN